MLGDHLNQNLFPAYDDLPKCLLILKHKQVIPPELLNGQKDRCACMLKTDIRYVMHVHVCVVVKVQKFYKAKLTHLEILLKRLTKRPISFLTTPVKHHIQIIHGDKHHMHFLFPGQHNLYCHMPFWTIYLRHLVTVPFLPPHTCHFCHSVRNCMVCFVHSYQK